MLGMHAPGKMGINHFVPVIHHAALCSSEGARIVRKNVIGSHIGTTFSCSVVEPIDREEKNIIAASKFDTLLNQ
jgi:beta-glucosidase